MKSVKKICYAVLLGVLVWELLRHPITLKMVAPACYRVNLSMGCVLMFSLCFRESGDKKAWLILIVKECLDLLFGNPGLVIWRYILYFFVNVTTDVLMLALFRWTTADFDTLTLKKGLKGAGFYIAACMLLNGIFAARLYAVSYRVSLSKLISAAGYYNDRIKGMFSFLVWSVAPFYLIELLLCIGVMILLLKGISVVFDKTSGKTAHAVEGGNGHAGI